MAKVMRRWLLCHGWVDCDYPPCRKVVRPRSLAMRMGWTCGGIAGAYDHCPEHREAVWGDLISLDNLKRKYDL